LQPSSASPGCRCNSRAKRFRGVWDAICSAAGLVWNASSATQIVRADYPTTRAEVIPQMLSGASAESIGQGATLALRCTMCHGARGMSQADSPNLAGQSPIAIYKQLNDFKTGARTSAIMAPLVANLSDADMRDLAAYYAYLPRTANHSPTTDARPRIVANGAPMRGLPPVGPVTAPSTARPARDCSEGSPWSICAIAVLGALVGAAGILLFLILGSGVTAPHSPGVVHTTEIKIAPEISGRVARFAVTPGQSVRKGDDLAERVNPELSAALVLANAQVGEARAARDHVYAGVRVERVDMLERDVDTARADLVFAEQQYARQAALAADGFASRQDLDKATAEVGDARAKLAHAEAAFEAAHLGPIREELAIADAKVEQAATARKIRVAAATPRTSAGTINAVSARGVVDLA
jgi:cytochrome c553